MGPIIPLAGISEEINLLTAFLIGIAFGFVLEQAGFSSSRKLAGMFYGYDATVLKVFFTAAITAMLGLLAMDRLAMIDLSVVYVNEYYMDSAILGGVIMGLGFIVGGFCPGTSFCAAAIGKIDAMVFILGGYLGVLLFGETYALWEGIYKANYLGSAKLSEALGLPDTWFVVLVVVAAVVAFRVAEWAEHKFARKDISENL